MGACVCVCVGSIWFLSMYGMWQANNIDKWDRLCSDAAPKIFARILNFKRACSMHSHVCTNKCVCSCGCCCNRSAFINFNFNSWFIFVVCFLTYFPCVFLFFLLFFFFFPLLRVFFSWTSLCAATKSRFVVAPHRLRSRWCYKMGIVVCSLTSYVFMVVFFRASSSHSLSHYFR